MKLNLGNFTVIALFLFIFTQGSAIKDLSPQNVAVKGGPTNHTDEFSVAWIEVALYPKQINAGQEIFIELNLTSQIKKVDAIFDFDDNPVVLFPEKKSYSWNRVYKIPFQTTAGIHVVKFILENDQGAKITRTLEFLVNEGEGYFADLQVEVLNDVPVVNDGKLIEKLAAGQKVQALYKAPFYRVKLADGSEGWVEASYVEEPLAEMYLLGYKSFLNKEYRRAAAYYRQVIDLDPSHIKARYWLAKSYLKLNDYDLAVLHLQKVLEVDPQNSEADALSSKLVAVSIDSAKKKLKKHDFKSAAKEYERVLILKPESLSTLITLGRIYKKLGLKEKAEDMWRNALAVDPENETVHSLLKTKYSKSETLAKMQKEVQKKMEEKKRAEAKKKEALSAKLPEKITKDFVVTVKQAKTFKGSSIDKALGSVLVLTKSLGTKISGSKWETSREEDYTKVAFVCRQIHDGKNEVERFEWKVDIDEKEVVPLNANAKLLMSRW